MYKAKLWDEDKWNIHSSNYSSSKYTNIFAEDKKEDKKYHEQKYGTKEKNPSSDYMKKEDKGLDSEDKRKGSFLDEVEEDKRKEQKDLTDEDIPFKAAKQIFREKKYEPKKTESKKDLNSIEEAIKKAIEKEKKVIVMDS